MARYTAMCTRFQSTQRFLCSSYHAQMAQVRTPLRLRHGREVAGGPFSGETSACNDCIRGLDRPLQLAWPDARHQTTSQWSLQHGARVVPRAAFAPSPALAVWSATSRSRPVRGIKSLCPSRCGLLAAALPPPPPPLHRTMWYILFPGPPAQRLVDDCGVALLHSGLWGSNHSPCPALFPAD